MLCPPHVCPVEQPVNGALGELVHALQTRVVAALSEKRREDALLDEAVDDLLQRRPVEGAELLLRNPAVGALVEREQRYQAPGGVETGDGDVDSDLRDDVERLQQLARPAMHVEDDALRATQRVADGVEGRLGVGRYEDRKSV